MLLPMVAPLPDRTAVATCPARAALAGNPSDGYGGAVVAVTVDALAASVTWHDAASFAIKTDDDDLARLLGATADAFAASTGGLPAVVLSAETTIPRSVGLAGSSALIIATLRSLALRIGHQWTIIELAQLALSIERDRLGIEAGLQDRLVQSAGGCVAMTFAPVAYHRLSPNEDLPLWIAWSEVAAEPSGQIHRSLRDRYDDGDRSIVAAMRQLTSQASDARRAIEIDDRELLATAMDRSFELRCSMIDVGSAQIQLVKTGRRLGAAVNSAGSGGSVIGLAPSRESVGDLRAAYGALGARFLELG